MCLFPPSRSHSVRRVKKLSPRSDSENRCFLSHRLFQIWENSPRDPKSWEFFYGAFLPELCLTKNKHFIPKNDSNWDRNSNIKEFCWGYYKNGSNRKNPPSNPGPKTLKNPPNFEKMGPEFKIIRTAFLPVVLCEQGPISITPRDFFTALWRSEVGSYTRPTACPDLHFVRGLQTRSKPGPKTPRQQLLTKLKHYIQKNLAKPISHDSSSAYSQNIPQLRLAIVLESYTQLWRVVIFETRRQTNGSRLTGDGLREFFAHFSQK